MSHIPSTFWLVVVSNFNKATFPIVAPTRATNTVSLLNSFAEEFAYPFSVIYFPSFS